MEIKIFDIKNIFKSLASAIMLSIVPFILTRDFKLLATNFLVTFIVIMVGCYLVDFLCEIKSEAEKLKNAN